MPVHENTIFAKCTHVSNIDLIRVRRYLDIIIVLQKYTITGIEH